MNRTTRRTLVRGAAWTAPVTVIAAAAPAYAVSGCVDAQALIASTVNVPVSATFPGNEVTATFAFSSSGYPPGTNQPFANALTVPDTPPWQYVGLFQPDNGDPGDSIAMTMTFSEAVSNLAVVVYGLDRLVDLDVDWADHVVVNTPGYTIPTRGPTILGTGSAADPLRTSTTSGEDFLAHFATVVWAGPLTQVQLSFVLGGTTVKEIAGQYVGLGRIGFTC